MEELNKQEIIERDALIDELVAKGGPTTGQIKANQDPTKVARLTELGWTPAEKQSSGLEQIQEKLDELADKQKEILETLADHEEKIAANSIRR